jgi:hypothetical protein
MIALEALKKVDPSRLAKACTALQEQSYFVTISRWSDTTVIGSVRGKEKTYTVALTTTSAHCECQDSRFHHRYCKHVALLALTLIRASQEVEEKRIHCGDTVEREGVKGKVIAISGDVLSVAWRSGRIGPVTRQELQLAA